MAVLKIRGEDGVVREVVSLKGEGGLASTTAVVNGENILIPDGVGGGTPLGGNAQTALENLADAFNGPYLYTDNAMQTNEQFNAQTFCNALKGKAEGELVTLRDVSPARHTVEVSVGSKNILPFPYKDTTKTSNGITWTVNADGTITANGTASGDSVFQLTDTFPYNDGLFCIISGCPTGGSADTYYLYSVFTGHREIGSGMSMTITDSRYWNFRIYIKSGFTADNLVFKPQVEKGTTATPYTPYIEDTSDVKVQVRGKNWLNTKFVSGGLSGATGDETNLTTRARVDDYIEVKPNTRYTISGTGKYIVANRTAYDKNKNWITVFNNTAKTPANTAYIRFHLTQQDNTQEITEEDLAVINALPIQLELGTTATEYEPYKAPIEYEQGEAIPSVYPSMTVTTDTDGALVNVEYNRDINKAFETLTKAIISLGGNV